VTRFTSRNVGVARIWRAIQPLAGNGQPGEPDAAKPRNRPRVGDRRRRRRRPGKPLLPKAGDKGAERANKKAEVIAMMKRARALCCWRSWKPRLAEAHGPRLRKPSEQRGRPNRMESILCVAITQVPVCGPKTVFCQIESPPNDFSPNLRRVPDGVTHMVRAPFPRRNSDCWIEGLFSTVTPSG
jgi:hypothetical protein